MAVRFGGWSFMLVLMMRVMDVAVIMLDLLMNVFVFIVFGEEKPQSRCHQDAGDGHPRSHRIAKNQDRECCAREKCQRK